MDHQSILLGPFAQIAPMRALPHRGPLADEALEVIPNGGILLTDGRVDAIGDFEGLRRASKGRIWIAEEIAEPLVVLPGFIDAHTHICFAGSRARDYSMRVAGKPYLEIARSGGGILDTVGKTRAASLEELVVSLSQRCDRHLREGVTSCEVKSGYGLSVEAEIKMLAAIRQVDQQHLIDLVPTCLAAHTRPPEFSDNLAYLEHINAELLPEVKARKLAHRVDIFVEDTAFNEREASVYLRRAQELGFAITTHADQFTPGGSALACEFGAVSADHLEASTDKEIAMLAKSEVIANVLPGVSLGLGMPFAPARKLLDHGACVAISTDWNPGSAPMGDLLMQAAVLGAQQKLTIAETLAGLTCRAALALKLQDRGTLAPGQLADMIAFPCDDHREILYHQGKLKPAKVWKRGVLVWAQMDVS